MQNIQKIRPLSPKTLLHTIILVYYNENYVPLEGHILDSKYLQGLKNKLQSYSGSLYGYAVATKDFIT